MRKRYAPLLPRSSYLAPPFPRVIACSRAPLSPLASWQYAKEDEEFKKKVEAKNGLENYCYSMKNTLGDDKLKDKLSDDDKSKAEKAIDDALAWLESNQLAEKEEFEHKQKEVEGICTPIMQSLYSQGGGMGGMPGGMVRDEPSCRAAQPRA